MIHKILNILLVTAAFVASLGASAQTTATKRPSLAVGIVVEGLDYDRLVELLPYMKRGGFNRLISKGVTLQDVDFGSNLDGTASAAIIFTGASPSVSGIPADTSFDVNDRRSRSIFTDKTQIGNFTDETYSPVALRVSTLADEVRMDAGGLGSVYSIASNPGVAIAMAGHAGNNGSWINDVTGRWATTAYYKDVPSPMQAVNHRNPLSARLDTLSWRPLLDGSRFANLPSYKRIYQFHHYFPRSDTHRYAAFKASATGNREVTDLAVDYLKVFGSGKREPVDMLNVAYTLQPYPYSRDADNRAELYDAYIRLDADLERLFSTIDTYGGGMDSAVVFLAGTPVDESSVPYDEKWGIPTGEFSPERAVSLLKMNLMSIFGNGDWVLGYHDGQFYLNTALIKERGLSLEQVRAESADFLRRLSGVTHAETVAGVLQSTRSSADSPFPPARNIDVDTAGDVFVAVAPGWVVTGSGTSVPAKSTRRVGGGNSAAFIMAPGLNPAVVAESVDARRIAPTVARLLRVRIPNGASLPSLRF